MKQCNVMLMLQRCSVMSHEFERQLDETAGSDIRQVLAKRSTFCKLQLAARGALSRRLAIQISLQASSSSAGSRSLCCLGTKLSRPTHEPRTTHYIIALHKSHFQLPVRVIVVQWQCSVLLQCQYR